VISEDIRARATALLDALGYRGPKDMTRRAREDARRYRAALASGRYPQRELEWAWAGNLDRSGIDDAGQSTVFGELAKWWPHDKSRPEGTIVLASLAGPGKTVGAIWLACHRGGEYITAASVGEIELSAEGKISGLIRTPVLVVDDLGDEATTGPTPQRMRRILKDRHAAMRTTVITTNLPPGEFAKRYGDHVLDRVTATGGYIVIKGKSRRRRGAGPDLSGITRDCEIADLVAAVDVLTGLSGAGEVKSIAAVQAMFRVTEARIEAEISNRRSWTAQTGANS